MSPHPRLRAVAPDETPREPARQSVAAAAETGDHRTLLVAMRDRIARTVSDPKCPPRDLAALTRRLQDIARELDQIDQRNRQEGGDREFVEDDYWDPEAL